MTAESPTVEYEKMPKPLKPNYCAIDIRLSCRYNWTLMKGIKRLGFSGAFFVSK